ncbi:hypothetical protein D3C85_1244560 [compost metagenome]
MRVELGDEVDVFHAAARQQVTQHRAPRAHGERGGVREVGRRRDGCRAVQQLGNDREACAGHDAAAQHLQAVVHRELGVVAHAGAFQEAAAHQAGRQPQRLGAQRFGHDLVVPLGVFQRSGGRLAPATDDVQVRAGGEQRGLPLQAAGQGAVARIGEDDVLAGGLCEREVAQGGAVAGHGQRDPAQVGGDGARLAFG